MNLIKNILYDVDSYKYAHFLQLPKEVTNISSYIEPRCSSTDEIVFFGLQLWLKNLDYVSTQMVDEAKDLVTVHGLPFNEDLHLLAGKPLPIQVQAIPEGSVVEPKTCLVQVTNTDPQFPWLTSFIETSLLRAIWYPTTVATKSREIKKIIKTYLERTADSTAGLPFKLHDFGFRGVSSYESGCIGGLAHLVNFRGTDTLGALVYARDSYHEPMAGYSIPATEHSTITSWGRDKEREAYENVLEVHGGPGVFACVSDSYDIYDACERIWGSELRDKVRDNGGTLVIRPDSGNPLEVVPKVLEILGDRFGTTTNSKQYRVLPDYLRVIQGDGMNTSTIQQLLSKLAVQGWSAENISFGMGGGLLQEVTRDDLSFAMKASAKSEDNMMSWKGFCKNPITQSGKSSRAGRLAVHVNSEGRLFTTQASASSSYEDGNVLKTVWEDGDLFVDHTLAEIRSRAEV